MCIAIIMTRQRLTLIQYYCVISVQMGSYFWSVFSCIQSKNCSQSCPKKCKKKKNMCIAIIMTRQRLTLIQCYWAISAQMRSYFWSVFSCIQSKFRKIRTRNNSVLGHFSRRNHEMVIYNKTLYNRSRLVHHSSIYKIP